MVAAPRDVRDGLRFEQTATLAALKSRKRLHAGQVGAHGLRADPAIVVAVVNECCAELATEDDGRWHAADNRC